MCIHILKTVCFEKNIPVLKFFLRYYLVLWKKTGVADKKLIYKTCANPNFKADKSNFIANYTARRLFELYV